MGALHHSGDRTSTAISPIRCFTELGAQCNNDAMRKEIKKLQPLYLNKIREIRIKLNLTQQAVADISDIPKQHISRLEKGQRRLNQDLMRKLSKALNCNPVDLLDDSDVAKIAHTSKLMDEDIYKLAVDLANELIETGKYSQADYPVIIKSNYNKIISISKEIGEKPTVNLLMWLWRKENETNGNPKANHMPAHNENAHTKL